MRQRPQRGFAKRTRRSGRPKRTRRPRFRGRGSRRGRPCDRPTERGRVSGAGRQAADGLDDEIEASTLGMIRELSRAGLTTFGSSGCEAESPEALSAVGGSGTARYQGVLHHRARGRRHVDQLLPRIAQMKLFQGDKFIDHIAYGEGVLGALSIRCSSTRRDPGGGPRPMAAHRRRKSPRPACRSTCTRTSRKRSMPSRSDRDRGQGIPVRNLRWALAHRNQPTAAQLERMKKLGLYAAVHPWAVIDGGINVRQFGERRTTWRRSPRSSGSGITWGLGSDGSRANQILPFIRSGGRSPEKWSVA